MSHLAGITRLASRTQPAILSLVLPLLFIQASASGDQPVIAPVKAPGAIRIATYNVSMNRSGLNRLTQDLERNDPQIKAVASVIRAVRPDVILLCEIDYSTSANNVQIFESRFLSDPSEDNLGNGPHPMPHHFSTSVNTGEPSGIDLNQNGRTDDPEDAWGFGRFPGQYGMAVLSRYEIDHPACRTFQNLLWSQLPGAAKPIAPGASQPYYDDATWNKLRLPSKSFWDVAIKIKGQPIHLLASHPTPPAFDGPEDRNGCRNHDEIRLITEYISSSKSSPSADSASGFWIDDQGRKGNLPQASKFIIAGDLNSDPVDGDTRADAIQKLLQHPDVQSANVPRSSGAVQAARQQAQKNAQHLGDPAFDTGDFNDQVVGNLRIDYVLPSVGFKVLSTSVVWPSIDDEKNGEKIKAINEASDHHLVWIDLEI